MVSAKFVKATKIGVAVICALAMSAAPGFAQSNKDNKGGNAKTTQPAQTGQAGVPQDIWYKLCMDVPVPEPTKPGEQPKKPEELKKAKVCVTQADIRESGVGILVGKVAVRQVVGQDKPVVFVMLPLSPNFQPLFPPGALVKIDEKDAMKLVYTTCDAAGCYAEATVEPTIINELKTGKQVAYLGIDVAGRALSIPVPLEGFAKAIDGPAEPLEKFNEEQRKIAELIRQRLIELRKQQEAAAAGQQQGQDNGAQQKQPGKK